MKRSIVKKRAVVYFIRFSTLLNQQQKGGTCSDAWLYKGMHVPSLVSIILIWFTKRTTSLNSGSFESMTFAPIFLLCLLLVGNTCASFFDELDEARSAMMAAEKAITKTPPASTKAPPAATKTPPAATKAPPAATKAPPAATKTPPTVKPKGSRPGGGSWASRRSRRRRTGGGGGGKPVTAKNHNKRNEAMYQVERAMTEAKLLRRRPGIEVLEKYIKLAMDNNNIVFARRALGFGIHVAAKSARAGKRGLPTNPVKKFIDNVIKKIKSDKSKKLFALEGDVTLMFAMDITGSMAGEIQAAKDIVNAISGYARTNPVDYILSAFGDPISQGFVKYKEEGKVDEFKNEVGKLPASGGGDCAEYAYNGMIDAVIGGEAEPKHGSPLYLFTDAPPKDATPENKDELELLAEAFSIPINVFSWKGCSHGPYSFDDFNKLAENTGGQFFELKSNELSKISDNIINTLGGSTAVECGNGVGTSGRRKRSSTKDIFIPIDETISSLVITVTTTNNPRGISLYSPHRRSWARKNTFSKVVVYEIKFTSGTTLRGIWRLSIPYSVGKFSYSAKVGSAENIDFLYYYSKIIRGQQVPISHPLSGESANLNFVVSRMEMLSKSSLSIDVIDVTGRVLQNVNKLKELGKSGTRFSASFQPPSDKRFKLKLKGKTKLGYSFQRISQNVNEAKPLLLKEFYTSRYYTIPTRGTTSILFYMYNTSNKRQCYTITLKDTLKFTLSVRGRQRCVRARARSIVRVYVQATGRSATTPGKGENIVVTAATRDKKIVTSVFVPFLVV